MRKAIIAISAFIVALLLLFVLVLNNSPNFLYPVTFKKDKFDFFFNEDYYSDIKNVYAFRNRENAIYIYDIDKTNRVIIWRFNELQQMPILGEMPTNSGECDQYTYLSLDFPEIVIHKKQGKYDRGAHTLEFSQGSTIINKTQLPNHTNIELILDRLFLVNSYENSEIIFEMSNPRLTQFHCIMIEEEFYFVLAYGLGDHPFNGSILQAL